MNNQNRSDFISLAELAELIIKLDINDNAQKPNKKQHDLAKGFNWLSSNVNTNFLMQNILLTRKNNEIKDHPINDGSIERKIKSIILVNHICTHYALLSTTKLPYDNCDIHDLGFSKKRLLLSLEEHIGQKLPKKLIDESIDFPSSIQPLQTQYQKVEEEISSLNKLLKILKIQLSNYEIRNKTLDQINQELTIENTKFKHEIQLQENLIAELKSKNKDLEGPQNKRSLNNISKIIGVLATMAKIDLEHPYGCYSALQTEADKNGIDGFPSDDTIKIWFSLAKQTFFPSSKS